MKSSFKCLYHLESDLISILEIRKMNLPIEAPKSDVYKWLSYNKANAEVIQLNFTSSDSSQDVQERYFEQGYLKFSQHSGTFIEKFNSAQYPLINVSEEELPHSLLTVIEDFLSLSKI
jgi:hypothetical protein